MSSVFIQLCGMSKGYYRPQFSNIAEIGLKLSPELRKLIQIGLVLRLALWLFDNGLHSIRIVSFEPIQLIVEQFFHFEIYWAFTLLLSRLYFGFLFTKGLLLRIIRLNRGQWQVLVEIILAGHAWSIHCSPNTASVVSLGTHWRLDRPCIKAAWQIWGSQKSTVRHSSECSLIRSRQNRLGCNAGFIDVCSRDFWQFHHSATERRLVLLKRLVWILLGEEESE